MLRKHEEEVVLVKSDQKRKITGLQDVINRLRQRVAECHKNIEKDEGALQAQNADIRRDPKTYAEVICREAYSRRLRENAGEKLQTS